MNELYGVPAETIAFLCKVSVTTARRWKKGRRRMPETARMILAADLGCFDPAFRGWSIRNGRLISPEGWTASAGDILTIPLMRAHISAHQEKERQLLAMDGQPLPGALPAIRAWD